MFRDIILMVINMIYVIETNEMFLAKKEINKIVNNESLMEFAQYFDAKDDFTVIQNAILSMPFFSEKNIVVVEGGLASTSFEHFLVEYSKLEDNNTLLFLIEKTLDKRKKSTTALLKKVNHIVVEALSPKNKTAYVENILKTKTINIDVDAKKLFIEKMPCNAGIIHQEIEKLQLFEDIVITKQIIDEYTTYYFEDSAFEFVEVFLNGTLSQRVAYYDRIKHTITPLHLLGVIASKVRLTYQVSVFSKKYAIDQLMVLLNAKRYPIQLALAITKKYTSNELLKMLCKMGELSYNIRHGYVDAMLAMEMFILKKGNL